MDAITSCSLLAAIGAALLVARPASAQGTSTPAASMGGANGALSRQLDSVARAAVEAGRAPGLSAAVVRGSDTLLLVGHGLADVERRIAATPRTIYRVGSITKEFTAAAVVRLADEGKLRLGDSLARALPDYVGPGGRVTVRQLLEHTSGILSFTRMGPGVVARARAARSRREVRDLFEREPLEFEPGTHWAYNNSGYWLLGAVIEAASGMPYGRYLHARFAAPLDLRDTRECDAGDTGAGDRRRAAGYDGPRRALERAGAVGTMVPFAAGALCSTVADLVRWQRALAAGRAVSPAAYALMTQPVVLANGRRESYGLGLELTELGGHRRVGHGGSIGGFDGYVAHYPDADLTVAVVANNGAANAEAVEKQLARRVLGLPDAKVARVPLDGGARARYLGAYDAGAGRLRIIEQGETVRVQGPVDAELVYQGADTFVLADEPDVRVVFTVEGGRATSLEWTARGRTLRARRLP